MVGLIGAKVVHCDIIAAVLDFLTAEEQCLVHRPLEAIAPAPVKALRRIGFARRRIVGARAHQHLAIERRRLRPPSRLELRPPARRQEHVHIHGATDIGVVGNERHGGVARNIEAPRADRDPVHRHAGPRQPLDGVVAAPGIGDDTIVGVRGRVCPPLGMRGFILGNGVDRDLH